MEFKLYRFKNPDRYVEALYWDGEDREFPRELELSYVIQNGVCVFIVVGLMAKPRIGRSVLVHPNTWLVREAGRFGGYNDGEFKRLLHDEHFWNPFDNI